MEHLVSLALGTVEEGSDKSHGLFLNTTQPPFASVRFQTNSTGPKWPCSVFLEERTGGTPHRPFPHEAATHTEWTVVPRSTGALAHFNSEVSPFHLTTGGRAKPTWKRPHLNGQSVEGGEERARVDAKTGRKKLEVSSLLLSGDKGPEESFSFSCSHWIINS